MTSNYKKGWKLHPKFDIKNVLGDIIFSFQRVYEIGTIINGTIFVKNENDEYSNFSLQNIDYHFLCLDI